MDRDTLIKTANDLADQAAALARKAEALLIQATQITPDPVQAGMAGGDKFIFLFSIFVLAVFVGYYVVWHVTPALHSPLMSVTNAISSVIIVGALIAAGPAGMDISKVMGFLAVVLASVNIFGGFIVTRRMLQMYKKKKR